MRGAKRRGTRYFGPYSHAWAIRETVDLLLRVFPVRTCSNGVFKRAAQVGRPCLLGYIEKCSAPCVGTIDAAGHRALAEDFCDFMSGQTQRFLKRLEREMHEAAEALEFERAARLRDDVAALRRALERNTVVLPDGTDADVFALCEDDLEAAVQVFHVRDGRVRGQRGWVVEKVEDVTTADLVEHLLQQVYGEVAEQAVPREVLVATGPTHPDELEQWLGGLRGHKVRIRVPRRGDKRALLQTVERNAAAALTLHKTRRAGDLTTRGVALQELQDALELPEAPLRIECYDVSTIAGQHTVASMVVFEDGLPRKSEYRRFTIRDGGDDLSAVHEVITRRFRRYLDERGRVVQTGTAGGDPEATAERHRFAYPPNLVVVDGGAPQVAAAARALTELGVDDVALCGLAKRLEEVWLPEQDLPVVLARSSQGLYLLQRLRDEAHRFAITHHRARRSRAMTVSELDAVPGLGPRRTKALLEAFGSVKALRDADLARIAEVPGIGPGVAASVAAALGAGPAATAPGEATGEAPEQPPGDMPSFDAATGEVLD